MSLAAHVLSHPLKHAAPSDLYDAAQSHHAPAGRRAGPGGTPAEDVLDGTFSALEYLAADAERLYAAAEERSRA
ncbi:hypothetical protein [Pseudomonas citronellolis]|uniref:hypothetical protein n=1 Tax=Pseudomonas citronellolis TaxID=53408 RepID=UPI002FD90959